jgi:acyl-CoA synthetase (AMP-forming)/AMP-acid ligase II
MELDGSTLRAFMAPHLARFQVPDDFEFVESIPRTATGKFLKNTLRDLYRHRQSITPG